MKTPEQSFEPVTCLPGVGPRMAEKLAAAGVERVQDLLFHLPVRYQDRTRITPMGALQVGSDVVVEGLVQRTDVVFGRRRSMLCRIQDDTGSLGMRFYHFSGAQKSKLVAGSRVRCFGEVRAGASGPEIYHPEYSLLSGDELVPIDEALTPVYPAPAGISQQSWRRFCGLALDRTLASGLQDLLPSTASMKLLEALAFLHRPPPDAPTELLRDGRHPAQLRLALEELVAHNLSLEKRRREHLRLGAQSMAGGEPELKRFIESLPFRLTAAQQRVFEEIRSDLSRSQPMLRLLQGDVGSGKTVVAAAAARQAIACGFQVAIMAPTEILAEQHRESFGGWFASHGIEPLLLTGRSKGKKRASILEAIASGEAPLVIGTHALFQEDVLFQKLGLVVVDEQHRFGVHQRLQLTEKGAQPHQLIMTATPIPRTLSMVAYADLDCSVIDELPPGRQPVGTVLIPDTRRDDVIDRLRSACDAGRQAYWVCTLIEESDALQAQAAESSRDELEQRLGERAVGLVHGRLKPAEKEAVMARFKAGDIQVLVATTVIEVGVDVPNASLMIIENPERLGLAQLHQLRGRVGRGSEQSHCVLLFSTPLSQQGQARLTCLRESSDGFYIAEQDLMLRGPGEVLGTRQTGVAEFRVADLRLHADLLDQVQQLAQHMADRHPGQVDALIRRWLGGAQRFAGV